MSRSPRISVCIPAYDMSGKGAAYLQPALESLASQQFDDFEVIVSDQSDTSEVEDMCTAYQYRMPLKHISYRDGPRQGSANCNNAMRHAEGEIIKVLFQDDYLCDASALKRLATVFEDPGTKWALMGSAVTRDMRTLTNAMVPKYTPRIRYGWNTISGPSVIALKAGYDIWFDENLIWLMDADIYHTCYEQLGEPVVLPETLVVNRIHDGQVSRNMDRSVCRYEVMYMARKQGLIRAPGDLGAFLWQYCKHIRL